MREERVYQRQIDVQQTVAIWRKLIEWYSLTEQIK